MRWLLPAIYFADAVFADLEPAPEPAPAIAAATVCTYALLVSIGPNWDFVVAGEGFEPSTSGL
jgi:hypothetical protein